MYIIGITGGTGAGKSTVVKALQAFGAEALDCDMIYHKLLFNNAEMISEIEASFRDVSKDGRIDRHKLGEIVWNDPALLKKLNNITHKYVDDEIKKSIAFFESQGVKKIAIDAIALVESGQSKKCDIVIGVLAPHEKRVSRIMSRDSITREYAQMRVNAQQQDSFYQNNCDYILENVYNTQADFEEKCVEFLRYVLKEKCHE